LDGTHYLLAYAADVNLLGDNIDTIRKNSRIDASKGVGVEVNTEKTSKCMLLSCQLNAGKNHNIKAAHRLFENSIPGNNSNK
jgi:hypothetical protein